jgi:hypothetical protein
VTAAAPGVAAHAARERRQELLDAALRVAARDPELIRHLLGDRVTAGGAEKLSEIHGVVLIWWAWGCQPIRRGDQKRADLGLAMSANPPGR